MARSKKEEKNNVHHQAEASHEEPRDEPSVEGGEGAATPEEQVYDVSQDPQGDAPEVKDVGDRVEELERENEQLQQRLQEQKDKYVRLMAEFENFQRRKDEERKRLVRSANEKLIEEFIVVKENFDRALESSKNATDVDSVRDGMQMIYSSFMDIFSRHGVEEFAQIGEEFDPMYHDALMKQPHEEIEEGKICNIYEKGYMLNDRVLKHAKVIVSEGVPDNAHEDE